MSPSHRLFAPAAMLVALALLGCGDSDADQRRAFIVFLQSRIVGRPGIHFPIPSEEETKSFGNYAKQYDVILDFGKDNAQNSNGLDAQFQALGGIRSLDQLIAQRETFAKVKAGIDEAQVRMKAAVAKADAAHALLKQPDDLRSVYDQAYAKDVTMQATLLGEIVPLFDQAVSDDLKLSDFVTSHPAQVAVSGGQLQVKDASVQAPLQGMLNDVAKSSSALVVAGVKLQKASKGEED